MIPRCYPARLQWNQVPIAILLGMMILCTSLTAQPLTKEEERIEEEQIQQILHNKEDIEQSRMLAPFPEQSAAVAAFIKSHIPCRERTVVILVHGGYRHTVATVNLLASALKAKGVPMLILSKGERAWIDAKQRTIFKAPVVIDTTHDGALMNIFGTLTGDYSPLWLTVWSCDGRLLHYYNLFQSSLNLDSLVDVATSVQSLSSTLRGLLRKERDSKVGVPGYRADSIIAAYRAAVPSTTIQLNESPELGLGTVGTMAISNSGRWFYFFQVGSTVDGGIVYDTKQNRFLKLPIDSVFFRQQSPAASDSLFQAFLMMGFMRALQGAAGSFDPCTDSLLYYRISYGNIAKVKITRNDSTGELDTTIAIGKTNWIAVYDVDRNRILRHIPVYDSFSIERFGILRVYEPTLHVPLCNPPLFVSFVYRDAYPRGYWLAEVITPTADPVTNPVTQEFVDKATVWALLDKQSGKCLGMGGTIGENKRALGIGYLLIPAIQSCADAAIIHEPWTDYVWIAPDAIRHRIKSYYNPSIVHPATQARYPASDYKINLLSSRAWADVEQVGITSNAFMLLWGLNERDRTADQSTIPLIWQRYDRTTGMLLSEELVPRFRDGMKATAYCFDSNGNLWVLYQDYHRSIVQQFVHQ
jgi:hypothetical protein